MRWLWLLLLVGCVVPEPGTVKEASIPEGQGQLVLNWKAETDRALLGSAWASATADAYELLLVGPVNRVVDLTLGAPQVVAVDPGTWRVLVLAGVKRTPGSLTAYLVGSAAADGVVVAAGQRTPVSLTLRSIDMSLAPAGAAYWKGLLAMTVSGKSRNARVGMLLAGASTTSRPRFKSVELWNGYREMTTVSGTPFDWSAEATGTVPDGAPSVLVGLVGAGLCVEDLSGSWVPTAGWTKYSWFWPNRAELTETHALTPYTEVLVPALAPPTGVDVAVTWE